MRPDPPEAPLVAGAADAAAAAPARAAALDEEDDLPLTTMFKTASASSVTTVAAERGKKMLELIGKVRDQRAALRKEEKAAAKKEEAMRAAPAAKVREVPLDPRSGRRPDGGPKEISLRQRRRSASAWLKRRRLLRRGIQRSSYSGHPNT